ncbi:MAG: peptidase M50 [Spirochaetes bacterium DG_61]|nr:MAG: peptidase M50 [Spirochaetes bacterium DG_61]
MFGKRLTVFKLLGFTVRLDLSWFFILILITWSLASGFFPQAYKGQSTFTYLLMGIAGALGLFVSIVIHELSHSLVARRFGLPMSGITLFIFGGVAEMTDEPPSPKAEFAMAIVGPITSIVIGGVFFGFSQLIKNVSGVNNPFYSVLRYLGLINGALALFNLIPAFPLDGGRVLRSAIWKAKNNLRSATRISSWIGSAFAFVLIAYGVFSFLRGGFIGGMWWFLIGLFLNNAARSSYQQVVMRQTLEGEKVSRFMEKNPLTVKGSITLRELVEDHIYTHHFKMYPVVERGKLIGCISTKEVKNVPKSEWDKRTVKEFAVHCSSDNSVTPDTDAINVLSKMKQTGQSRLMVVENGKLVGVITLKDMLNFISLKVELEEGA